MPTAVTPPNPNMEFVLLKNDKYVLSPVAFRFLTNIVKALNGQPTVTINDGINDQEISQFAFGEVTLSTGDLFTPEGLLPGNIGDVFISTQGYMYQKQTGSPGGTGGWVALD